MKHKVLKIFMILFPSFVLSQNVYIPDSTFKTALIVQNNIDTNYDGEIQVSEAIAFTGGIYVPAWGINDLTGIEAFINLTELDCSWNNITTLDISANTELVFLDIHNNLLMDLDLNSNIALQHLICLNNQFDSLDLTYNANLKTLNCTYNNITELDLSANTALETVKLGDNDIATLDLAGNSQLISFECNHMSELTSLNIANNNNENITSFSAFNNEDLNCIQVDNEVYSMENWINLNGSTVFSEDCSALSLPEHSSILSLYPNPVTSHLYLEILEDVDYSIISLKGQIVKSGKLFISDNKLNVIDLSDGIYIFFGKTSSGKLISTSIIKK
jgi:hypothetical protein